MPKARPASFVPPSCVVCGGPTKLVNRQIRKTCSPECFAARRHQVARSISEKLSNLHRKYGTPAEAKLTHRRRLKLDVLRHYSFGEMKCACCGDDHVEFLTIDHIDGGGADHRRSLGKGNIAHGGGSFYPWLARNGYPPGYRVLCQNCNFSMGVFGYCPHAFESEPGKSQAALFIERSAEARAKRAAAKLVGCDGICEQPDVNDAADNRNSDLPRGGR